MRIGFLCHASLGGSARVATELAAEMALRGHRVHLFSHTVPHGREERLGDVDLHTVAQPNGRHPAQLYVTWPEEELHLLQEHILQVIQSEGLDVLHIHYAVPFVWVAAALKERLGAAAPLMVVTLHGTDVTVYGHDPHHAARLKTAIKQMDLVTSVSRAHAQLAAEIFALPARPFVIPNFVDLAQFRLPVELPGGKYGSGGTARIIHASNFRPVKNIASVARIFCGIRREINAELWLIGEGQDMYKAKAVLSENGFEDDARYWGIQNDVAPFFRQATLILLASHYESFCLTALEGMACGLPVLASDVGGLSEVVSNGETGLLFPPGDEAMAVAQAVRLLKDPYRHAALIEAAVKRARLFSSKLIIPLYENLYRDCVRPRQALYENPG